MSCQAVHKSQYPGPDGFAIAGGIIFLPVVLPVAIIGALGYGIYTGVRLAAKQITIATNKVQAARLQLIIETTLQLQGANVTKDSLERWKDRSAYDKEFACKNIPIETAIAAMENPIKPQDINSQPEGPKELLIKAQELIDNGKKNAEGLKRYYQDKFETAAKELEKTEMQLQDVATRIATLSETLKTTQQLYKDAGGLSKIKENLITWQSAFKSRVA